MLFEKLIDNSNGRWHDYINHQLIFTVVTETTIEAKFKNYLEQNYYYFCKYLKCYEQMDLENSCVYNQNSNDCFTFDLEQLMYEKFELDLKNVQPSMITSQYLNYLYEIMATGSMLEKNIVIWTRIIGMGFTANNLLKKGEGEKSYLKDWIDFYQSDEVSCNAKIALKIMNSLNPSDKEYQKIQEIFNNICKFEIKMLNQALSPVKPNVLTIAGSDSSGGAGIQADIKTISANGGYAASVITALTAQNTQGVSAVFNVDPDLVLSQLNAVQDDLDIAAIKIGMLSQQEIIKVVSAGLNPNIKVVLDPVMVAKDNTFLIDKSAINDLVKYLFPKAFLITPNIVEASQLLGIEITNEDEMKVACEKLSTLGCPNVLLKGGHLNANQLVDVLYTNNQFYFYKKERIFTKDTHGTGCSLSSAIATNLAKGLELNHAVKRAIDYVYDGIIMNYQVGSGCSPINHFHQKWGRYHE